MTIGKDDVFAQYLYQAQLQAAKNQCKCITCQLLRKASDLMAAQLLKTQIIPQTKALEGLLPETGAAEETISLEEVS